jgi:hypothetical protein
MRLKQIDILPWLLFFSGLCFIILYCVLSFNSRLASDDFYYLYLTNKYGALDGMIFQYANWSGRWSAHFLACTFLVFWKSAFFLPAVDLITLGGLYISMRSGLKKIFSKLEVNANGVLLPGLTIALITALFFASFSIGESWFWYIIIITYMWSLIAFLFICNYLFSESHNTFDTAWVFICALFIGGASESFALIFVLILITTGVYGYRKNSEIPNHKKIFMVTGLILISFLISVAAPGTEIRRSLLPQTDVLFKIITVIKSLVKYFIYYLPRHAGFIFLFSFPWLLFGNRFLKNKFSRQELMNVARICTYVFLIGLIVIYLPTVYIMSDAGPDRALLLVSFITVLYASIFFSVTGAILVPLKGFRIISTIIGDLSILVLIIFIYFQTTITGKFAGEYDKRINYLLEKKKSYDDASSKGNSLGMIEVERLPESGMLYWEDLSPDTSYFTNKHLKAGLDLPYTVKIRQ